jgi:hypothetical protein
MPQTETRGCGRLFHLGILSLCLLGFAQTVAADVPRITRLVGPEDGREVTGVLKVETLVTGLDDDADYDVRYQIDGPSGFIDTARDAPFVLCNGHGWDTADAKPGDYTLHAFLIRNHRVVDFRIVRFTVVRNLKIERIRGVEDGDTLTEPVQVQAFIDGPRPTRVIFELKGDQEIRSVERYDPYVMLGDGRVWDVTEFPPGPYTLTVTAYLDDKPADTRTLSFQIAGPVPQTPEPGMAVGPGPAGDPAPQVGPDAGPLPDARARGFLGINLADVTYYTREWVFVDAMKQSRPWLPTRPGGNPWDTGEPLKLNEDGWPILRDGQAAHTIMMIDTRGAYPPGRYVCTYDGDGTIEFGYDAKAVSRSGRRIELDVSPTDRGIYLRIDRSNPSNPVRNVKVWLPGFENARSSFHPLYISRLKPFSVIRFMDWQRTNGSGIVSWSDRPQPDYYTQGTARGAALKYMIELCNELGADPWFCMPHQADDGYVRQFAAQVKAQLRPDLNVYVEWSNEVWNSQFPQHNWVKDRSGADSLSEGFRKVWADEANRDFELWRDAFGPDSNRVIRVAAGQKDNPWVTEKLAEALDGRFDAISCSTYFSFTSSQRRQLGPSTSAGDILDMAMQEMTRGVRRNYQAHGNLARAWSTKLGRTIPLIGYEGGQHYTASGANPPWARALIDVQRHPRMYEVYLANMREWENAGGSLFTAFNFVEKPDKWGSWGQLEFMDQDIRQAPKYRALIDYEPTRAAP